MSKQNKKKIMYTTCSELVVFMYWTGKSMNNLLSYCGLVDARISASEKDLPVLSTDYIHEFIWIINCLMLRQSFEKIKPAG